MPANLAYKAARSIGLAGRMIRNRISNLLDSPVVVLIYHRVTTLPSDRQQLAVAPHNFRSHLQYLKANFPVVRFEDDWSSLKEPAVAVTFDDGYADNAREALPILEEVGVPGTFFVSTGLLGTRLEFWWDELERVILGEGVYPPVFELKDPRYGRLWSAETIACREILYSDLHALILNLPATRREEWLDQLRAWAGAGREGRIENRSMMADELMSLGRSQWVTVGAHTVTHSVLSALSEEEQRQEIVASRRQLEELLGREVTVFSYPFGTRAQYNRTSVRICREAGFRKAASNFPGQAHRWTDPYQIPRQLVRNWDAETFAVRLKGFWT